MNKHLPLDLQFKQLSIFTKVILLSVISFIASASIFILASYFIEREKEQAQYKESIFRYVEFIRGYVRDNPDYYLKANTYLSEFSGLLGLRIRRGEEEFVYTVDGNSADVTRLLLNELPDTTQTLVDNERLFVYAHVEGIDLDENMVIFTVFSKSDVSRLVVEKAILAGVVAVIAGALFVMMIYSLLKTHFDRLQYLQRNLQGLLESRNFPTELSVMMDRSDEVSELASSFTSIYQEIRKREKQNQQRLLDLQAEIQKREALENEKNSLQRQLFHAQKMESIGQLAGGIAHDFNNILSSIIGYSKLLRSSVIESNGKIDPDRSTDYLDEVIKAGDRAKSLIGNMLSFSRGEKTASAAEQEVLAPVRALEDSLSMLKSVLPSSLQINTIVEPDLPGIKADSLAIHQILMNLLINARDAMEGQGDVHISVYLDNAPFSCSSCHQHVIGSYVVFEVRDHGAGIDSSSLENIFEPFFSTKEVGKGTGMGLSIVHGIVHDLSGHIDVESTLGVGTVFKILLPVAMDSAWKGELESDSESPVQPGQVIMLVDDDVPVARFIAHILEGEDFKVEVFYDPLAALAVYQKNPQDYAAIITDNMMPGLTGEQLVNRIREFDSGVPIMICTGFRGQLSQEFLSSGKFTDIFDKPIDVDKLVAAVSKAS